MLDDRWLEVLTWKIKDNDSYIESRKRLGQSQKGQTGGGKGQPAADAAKPGPKRPAKGKNGKEAKGTQKGQVALEEALPGPVQ